MKPTIHALIICDSVHVDPGTGKHTLLGVFQMIRAETLPTRLRQIWVYAAVSGVRSRTTLDMEFARILPDGGPDQRVGHGRMEIQAADPHTVSEVAFALHETTLPAAGVYRFTLIWDGEPVAERRLQVTSTQG